MLFWYVSMHVPCTHAARAILQVGALCSPFVSRLMGYADTSDAGGLRALQIRAIQMGYADDTSDAGGHGLPRSTVAQGAG